MVHKRIISAFIIVAVFCSAPGISSLRAGGADQTSHRSLGETLVRGGLAFAVTTGIKGLFGMAPGYICQLIPSVTPAMSVPILVGAGLLEGIISLSVYSAITGVQDRKWLVRSYLAASVVSVLMTFMLGGVLAPWLTMILSNVARLVVFSLLTRPPNTSLAKHLVDDVVTVGSANGSPTSPGSSDSMSLVELEQARRKAYATSLSAETFEERVEAHGRFIELSDRLSVIRAATAISP